MLRNQIIPALRFFWRHKIYSGLNILGLAIAFSSTFIILLFLLHEFNHNKIHTQREHIYQSLKCFHGLEDIDMGCNALAPSIMEATDNMVTAAFMDRNPNETFFIKKGKEFIEESGSIYRCNPTIFKIFDVPIKMGNPETMLSTKNKAVISERMANKYFGDENPMGKSLELYFDKKYFEYTVTGLFSEMPSNSSFDPDIILHSSAFLDHYAEREWSSLDGETYYLLPENYSPETLTEQLNQLVKTNVPDATHTIKIQKLEDQYWNPNPNMGWLSGAPMGDKNLVYVFSSIAILILIIAGINFAIFSLAMVSKRSKEISIKKINGAKRSQIIRQILLESTLLSVIAIPIALILTERLKPLASNLFDKEIIIDYQNNWQFLFGICLIPIILGLISSLSYSLKSASLNPITLLQDAKRRNGRGLGKKVLITIQLIIFTSLTIVSLIVNKQVNFIYNHDKGIDMSNKIIVHCDINNWESIYQEFKKQILRSENIIDISASYSGIGSKQSHGNTTKNMEDQNIHPIAMIYQTMDNYPEMYGIELQTGSYFSQELTGNNRYKVVINEQLLKDYQLHKPYIGETIYTWGETSYEVIGVCNNFTNRSIRQNPWGIILSKLTAEEKISELSFKYTAGKASEALSDIENIWDDIMDGRPMKYDYSEDVFKDLYIKDQKLNKSVGLFTLLSIIIAAIGLFGLSFFEAEQKYHEIGIRKTLGANYRNIIGSILKKYIMIILLANVISWPIAWFSIRQWFQGFVLRTHIGADIFIYTALISISIVFLAMIYNSLRASRINPVESLRYE